MAWPGETGRGEAGRGEGFAFTIRGVQMELLRESLPVQAAWVGSGITAESKRSFELRMALIRAQQRAIDRLDGRYPANMKVSWRITMADDSEWEWNPQVGVPDNAVTLVFLVEDLDAP